MRQSWLCIVWHLSQLSPAPLQNSQIKQMFQYMVMLSYSPNLVQNTQIISDTHMYVYGYFMVGYFIARIDKN